LLVVPPLLVAGRFHWMFKILGTIDLVVSGRKWWCD
jgi:hypothetical protein